MFFQCMYLGVGQSERMSVEHISCWPPNEDEEDATGDHKLFESKQSVACSSKIPRNRSGQGEDDAPEGYHRQKRMRCSRGDEDNKEEPLATIALARWWRSRHKSLGVRDMAESTNPNTILKLAAR